jgi:cobaltochelatase CobN
MNKVSYSWTLDEKGNIVITKQKENYEYLLTNVDLITQNFDSTWRFLDSDDYYDWFGGLKNAADIFKANAGKDKADTQFVDIRNKNNYVSRTYEEELDFEIRSMILNPKYYETLVKSDGGALAYSSKMQNLYAGLVVGKSKLNSNLGNQIASTYLDIASSVDSVSKAAAWQSMAAWMLYLDDQGLWNGDKDLITGLANSMVQMAPVYGVACCHHTCANLNFNMMVLMKSTLSAQEKQKYADTLSKATLTDPIYDMNNQNQQFDPYEDSSQDINSQDINPEDINPDDINPEDIDPDDINPQEKSNNNNEHNGDVNNNQNANVLANGTVKDSGKSSDNAKAGGKTAVGDDYSSDPSNAKVDPETSDVYSSESEAAGSSEAGGAKAYELKQQSTSKSSVSTESSMPIFVIIAVICLIAIFLVGYLRKDNDEYDDY